MIFYGTPLLEAVSSTLALGTLLSQWWMIGLFTKPPTYDYEFDRLWISEGLESHSNEDERVND